MDISTVTTFVKQVLATFLTLIMMVFPFGDNGTDLTYTAENPDELIVSFSAVSDIHVETNNPDAYNAYSALLKGLKAGEDHDAVVYLGDNVMNGQLLENFFFYTAIKAVMPSENNLVVSGNHDLGNGEGDYEDLLDNYISNNNTYLGKNLTDSYYYQIINGCYFIVLASEDTGAEEFRMSDEQFEWLENVLIEADVADAPVFVFNHFPIRYLRDKDPASLSALLNKYNTLLFVHGHIHSELGKGSFYNWDGINCVNLPRSTEVVDYEPGDGIVVELYENRLLVRGRDFIKGEWVEGLEYSYALS